MDSDQHRKLKLFFLLLTVFENSVLSSQPDSIRERKFAHSYEELLLTEKVSEEIYHPGCLGNASKEIVFVVHSAAQSSGEYFERRQVTRQTWASDANENNIQVIFAIGLPRDQTIQLDLINEQAQYGDLVQFEFIDDYYNLTLKAIAVANWLSERCTSIKIIAKVDDDIFVNVGRLVELQNTFSSGITGHMYVNQTQPDRNVSSRYYMPEEIYPDEWYPRFVSGLFYVTTQDILRPLSQAASNWSEIILDFDDLYMTGIVGERIGLKRFPSSEMVYREATEGCEVEVSELSSLIAFHGCSSVEDSRELYFQWKASAGYTFRPWNSYLLLLTLLVAFS